MALLALLCRRASDSCHDCGADSSDLTDAEYQEAADTTMDLMHENLETMCEEFGPETWEVEYSVSTGYILAMELSPCSLLRLSLYSADQSLA